MERESRKNYQTRRSARGGSGGGTTSERDLLLQWGNRKRLRCVKVQRRDVEAAATVTAEKAAAGQRRAAAVAAVAAATAAGQHHPTGHAYAHHRGLRSVPPAALLCVCVCSVAAPSVSDKIQNHRVLKEQLAVTWYLSVGT
ncbi:hypothetical protein ACQ4PT_044947 [Festuca glaucescens]